jgi:hypothetical protein
MPCVPALRAGLLPVLFCLQCLLAGGALAGWGWDEEGEEGVPSKPMTSWYRAIMNDVARSFPGRELDPMVIIRVAEQRLYLIRHGILFQHYPVSTSRHGTGNRDGSFRTPLGVHQVRRKIGAGAPLGTVFRGRRDTGEIARILTNGERSPDDNITSRILWLDGLEKGVNRGEDVDSFQRFIYIHGTDEEGLVGRPASDGCVRMTNQAVVDLFEQVPERTVVVIVD